MAPQLLLKRLLGEAIKTKVLSLTAAGVVATIGAGAAMTATHNQGDAPLTIAARALGASVSAPASIAGHTFAATPAPSPTERGDSHANNGRDDHPTPTSTITSTLTITVTATSTAAPEATEAKHLHFSGTIVSASASSLTISTKQGTTVTAAITLQTHIEDGNHTPPMVSAGDRVQLQVTVNADGSYTATGIEVRAPEGNHGQGDATATPAPPSTPGGQPTTASEPDGNGDQGSQGQGDSHDKGHGHRGGDGGRREER